MFPSSTNGQINDVPELEVSQLEESNEPTEFLSNPLDAPKAESTVEYASRTAPLVVPPEPSSFHHDTEPSPFSFPSESEYFPRTTAADYQSLVTAGPSPGASTPNEHHLSLGLPLDMATTIQQSTESLDAFVPLAGMTAGSAAFPSQLLDSSPAEVKMERELSRDLSSFDQFSPESLRSPSATPDMAFKVPQPIVGLASRRKMQGPAPLSSTALRSASYAGPRTGMDMPKRSEATSPIGMRRMASATGISLTGRISKPVSMSAAPRSPLYFDKRGGQEALMQMATAARSPVMGGGVAGFPPHSSSAAPLTPITPMVSHHQLQHHGHHGMREMSTVSSTSSDDDCRAAAAAAYTYRAAAVAAASGVATGPFGMDPSIGTTPPQTPGLMSGFPDQLFAANYNFGVSAADDQPLTTPVLGAFGGHHDVSSRHHHHDFSGPSLHMPSYIANPPGSQPPTPSFAPGNVGPAYFALFPGSNSEYNWNPSEVQSARSSPVQVQSKPKPLQFTNITPQDFQR